MKFSRTVPPPNRADMMAVTMEAAKWKCVDMGSHIDLKTCNNTTHTTATILYWW